MDGPDNITHVSLAQGFTNCVPRNAEMFYSLDLFRDALSRPDASDVITEAVGQALASVPPDFI
jgi:hypothetical protein